MTRLVLFVAFFLMISLEMMGGAEGKPQPAPQPAPQPQPAPGPTTYGPFLDRFNGKMRKCDGTWTLNGHGKGRWECVKS